MKAEGTRRIDGEDEQTLRTLTNQRRLHVRLVSPHMAMLVDVNKFDGQQEAFDVRVAVGDHHIHLGRVSVDTNTGQVELQNLRVRSVTDRMTGECVDLDR